MKNGVLNFIGLASAAVSALLAGCGRPDTTFSVRKEMVDVGSASIGDSVKASFTFRNNKSELIELSFIPECDCTTVDSDMLKLEPHQSGRLEVKVAVESPGEFVKYVYVQASGDENFMTIAVKGRTND